jgi:hypothetical protein
MINSDQRSPSISTETFRGHPERNLFRGRLRGINEV